ncbi:MAG: invasion associated locus B family protein [Roseitalea porphyridii]|uniref:invasion associated locus B family protein n=1 Tax=Roseitalea porphyridii TaxID=1852022 RepID=UPI0032D935E7
MRRALVATGAAIVAVAAAGFAHAQDQTRDRVVNGERFGAWTVNCEALAVNETVCVLNQRLVRSADRVFLAEFLAFDNTGELGAFLAARVPLGVHFPSGFSIRPDQESEDVLELAWQSCATDLCEALIPLDAEQIASLSAADGAIAGYRPRFGADPLVFRVDLTGLADGLAALARATGAADGDAGAEDDDTDASDAQTGQ